MQSLISFLGEQAGRWQERVACGWMVFPGVNRPQYFPTEDLAILYRDTMEACGDTAEVVRIYRAKRRS